LDVEQMIAGLKDLERAELERLEVALDRRLRKLRQESPVRRSGREQVSMGP
jgi:hypothetical protein